MKQKDLLHIFFFFHLLTYMHRYVIVCVCVYAHTQCEHHIYVCDLCIVYTYVCAICIYVKDMFAFIHEQEL